MRSRMTGRTIIIATVLAALAAGVATATVMPTVWFSDNFNGYTSGTRLRSCVPNWGSYWLDGVEKVGPENYVRNDFSYEGTGNAVRLRGMSGSGNPSYAETLNSVGGLSAGKLSILHFRLMAEQYPTYLQDHAGVYMVESNGHVIAGWAGSCYRMKSKYSDGGGEGVQWNYPDAGWHDFDISYDPATGTTNWYADGSLNWTQTLTAGKTVTNIYVRDTHQGADNHLWLDDVALGTPEPGSLLAFCAGVVGLLAAPRRRRFRS